MWTMAAQVAVRGVWGAGGGGHVSSRKPAVQRLSAQELPVLLPWSGCGSKLAKEVGSLEASTARVAVSLVACALVYGTSNELATLAGFYWAWAPILGTLLPNLLLRLRYGYAGVWSARVINVQLVRPQRYLPDDRGGLPGLLFNRLPRIPSRLKLEIGDGSPATFTMQVPVTDGGPGVQPGERVDVMVVSDKPSLSRFKALHDVYFPERQLWISENPCVEREPFERMQESLRPPLKQQNRQGRVYGRSAKLLLEENTLSRDSVNWEKALRSDPSSGISRERDYVRDIQEEKTDRRPVKKLDDPDLYL